MYELASAPIRKKEIPASPRKKLSVNNYFILSDGKIDGYYIIVGYLFRNKGSSSLPLPPQPEFPAKNNSFSVIYFQNSYKDQ